MLGGIGIAKKGMSHKSFKSLAVTKALDKGMPPDNVTQHGRWRTAGMPLHYKVNTVQYKEKIAGQVPV